MCADTAAAEPLEEPPGVRAGSSGLRVSVGCMKANSQVFALPTTIAPAASSSTTSAASARGWWPR